MFFRKPRDFLQVQIPIGSYTVLYRLVVHARCARFPTMGEVPAGSQQVSHYRVARLARGKIDGKIRGGAGIRLDVRVRNAEKLLGPVACEVFNNVDDIVTSVI